MQYLSHTFESILGEFGLSRAVWADSAVSTAWKLETLNFDLDLTLTWHVTLIQNVNLPFDSSCGAFRTPPRLFRYAPWFGS